MTAKYAYIDLERIKAHKIKARLIDANTGKELHHTYYKPKFYLDFVAAMNELRDEASEAGYYIIDKPDLKGGKMR